jgi:hypothetical protein
VTEYERRLRTRIGNPVGPPPDTPPDDTVETPFSAG